MLRSVCPLGEPRATGEALAPELTVEEEDALAGNVEVEIEVDATFEEAKA